MDFSGLDRQFVTAIQNTQLIFGRTGHRVSWSGKGDMIAYTSGSDVWVTNVRGQNPQNLTNDTILQLNVSWSPDGGLIAFDQATLGEEPSIWTIDPVSGVRNKLSPEGSYALPTWGRLWAPGTETYFVWGDTRCDGSIDLLDVLEMLKDMANTVIEHVPGCPWLGDNGLNTTGSTSAWGAVTCGQQEPQGEPGEEVSAFDVIAVMEYLLDLNIPRPENFLDLDCPPIGSYVEFISAQ
jgi:hypothetical protein